MQEPGIPMYGAAIKLEQCGIVENDLSIKNWEAGEGWIIGSNNRFEDGILAGLDGAATEMKIRKSDSSETQKTEWTPHVSYRTHVQSFGWQFFVNDGELSGTIGQSLRLEGINIMLSNMPYSGGIQYRTHVQTYGWQDWKQNGEMAGTQGESKRLEAIQIQLTGELAGYYDVYYQTHIQQLGWSGWACNGEMCGSAGYSYRLEGIRIQLVKKGDSAPGSTSNTFTRKAVQQLKRRPKLLGHW